MRWLDSITNSTDMNLSQLREIAEDRGGWWAAAHEVAKSLIRTMNKNRIVGHCSIAIQQVREGRAMPI